MVRVMPHKALELRDPKNDGTSLDNGKRVKHYWGGGIHRRKTLIDLFDIFKRDLCRIVTLNWALVGRQPNS